MRLASKMLDVSKSELDLGETVSPDSQTSSLSVLVGTLPCHSDKLVKGMPETRTGSDIVSDSIRFA